MAHTGTLIIRAALEGRRSIWREIEIEASGSLYELAEAIVAAFGFDFDHAFGFYSGLTPAKMMRERPKYELFVDMGDAEPGAISVKKTSVSQAFPAIGHSMIFPVRLRGWLAFSREPEGGTHKSCQGSLPARRGNSRRGARAVSGLGRGRRGRAALRGQPGDRRKDRISLIAAVGWAKAPGANASGGVPTIQSSRRDNNGGHGARAPLPTLRVFHFRFISASRAAESSVNSRSLPPASGCSRLAARL
jgi:hypothetical protein